MICNVREIYKIPAFLSRCKNGRKYILHMTHLSIEIPACLKIALAVPVLTSFEWRPIGN